jgi:hypothetical protein
MRRYADQCGTILAARILEVALPTTVYTPHEGRMLLSDILGRRRPVRLVRESYPIRVQPCKRHFSSATDHHRL